MSKRPRPGTASGVITVFLSLILLLVFGLVCTCLESARAAGLRLKFLMSTDSALESVFAQYDRVLWDRYCLLFFADSRGDGQELAEIAGSYLEKNSGAGTGTVFTAGDWFRFRAGAVTAEAVVTAVEQDGRVFRRAVAEYMEAAGIAEAAVRYLKDRGLVGESGGLTEEEQGLADLTDIDLAAIHEKVEAAEAGLGPEEDDEDSEPSGSAELAYDPFESPAAKARRRRERGKYSGILSVFRKWRRSGILGLVLEDGEAVSDERLDSTDLPSALPAAQKNAAHAVLPDDRFRDWLLLVEYTIRHLDCQTTPGGAGCEVEYVLAGKTSDRENLRAVVKRLLGVRFALDLGLLLTDAERKFQADELAFAVAGWTLNPAIVTLVTDVILAVWSAGESINDVKMLLAGGKVPLIKRRDEWRTDLFALGDADDTPGSRGLGYEDYLRALLLVRDRGEVTYRVMDVIQRRVRETEPAFRMKNCIYAAKIAAKGTGTGLFPALPGAVTYQFSEQTSFSYGEVVRFGND